MSRKRSRRSGSKQGKPHMSILDKCEAIILSNASTPERIYGSLVKFMDEQKMLPKLRTDLYLAAIDIAAEKGIAF